MYNLSKIHEANNNKAKTTQSLPDQKALNKRQQDRATYFGTTPKHLMNRLSVAECITTYTNTYDHIMMAHRKSNLRKLPKCKVNNTLKMEMDNFFLAHPYAIHNYNRRCHKRTALGEPITSDDTKEVEKRPLKQDINISSSAYSLSNTSKQICTLASDSKQAVSSRRQLISFLFTK
ncbi:unnamed protein product [Rhizophagus irregularis]|nr:unnamed protein product [Rhizophagus irregularis]